MNRMNTTTIDEEFFNKLMGKKIKEKKRQDFKANPSNKSKVFCLRVQPRYMKMVAKLAEFKSTSMNQIIGTAILRYLENEMEKESKKQTGIYRANDNLTSLQRGWGPR